MSTATDERAYLLAEDGRHTHALRDAYSSILARTEVTRFAHRGRVYVLVLPLAVGVSATARVPFIPINLRIRWFGPVFCAGSILGWTGLESWSAKRTIDHTFLEDRNLIASVASEGNHGMRKKLAIGGISFFVALLSQVPQALAAREYNHKDIRVAAALVTLVAGSFFPTHSMQLILTSTVDRLTRGKILDERTKKLTTLKRQILQSFSHSRVNLLQSDTDSQKALITAFNTLIESDHEQISYTHLRALLATVSSTEDTKPRCAVLPTISTVVGGILTASLQTVFAMYTYSKAKEYVYDAEWFGYTSAAVVTAANVRLLGQSVIHSLSYVLLKSKSLFIKSPPTSYAELLAPRLTFCLKALAFVVDIFAVGAPWVIFGNYYRSNVIVKRYAQISSCTALMLCIYAASMDIINDIVERSIVHFSRHELEQLITINRRLERVKGLLTTSSMINWALFISQAPEDLKIQLLRKAQMTQLQLAAFIREEQSRDVNAGIGKVN